VRRAVRSSSVASLSASAASASLLAAAAAAATLCFLVGGRGSGRDVARLVPCAKSAWQGGVARQRPRTRAASSLAFASCSVTRASSRRSLPLKPARSSCTRRKGSSAGGQQLTCTLVRQSHNAGRNKQRRQTLMTDAPGPPRCAPRPPPAARDGPSRRRHQPPGPPVPRRVAARASRPPHRQGRRRPCSRPAGPPRARRASRRCWPRWPGAASPAWPQQPCMAQRMTRLAIGFRPPARPPDIVGGAGTANRSNTTVWCWGAHLSGLEGGHCIPQICHLSPHPRLCPLHILCPPLLIPRRAQCRGHRPVGRFSGAGRDDFFEPPVWFCKQPRGACGHGFYGSLVL
jgi:hypothetical protein